MKIKFILSILASIIVVGGALLYFGLNHSKNINQPLSEIKKIDTLPKTVNLQTANITQKQTANITPKIASDDSTTWLNKKIEALKPLVRNLNVNVLRLGLTAYQNAQKRGVTANPLLTIIDFSKPSSERRLWVIDVEKHKVLFNTLVAHGKNSGNNLNASSFSNRENSLKSSLGVFVTKEIYQGKHGNSLRISGLESGINDNAYDRSIVIHGASYVSERLAKARGAIGRSWGCPAVSEDIIGPLIRAIKNKAIIVAYYHDKNWLNKSIFLK